VGAPGSYYWQGKLCLLSFLVHLYKRYIDCFAGCVFFSVFCGIDDRFLIPIYFPALLHYSSGPKRIFETEKIVFFFNFQGKCTRLTPMQDLTIHPAS